MSSSPSPAEMQQQMIQLNQALTTIQQQQQQQSVEYARQVDAMQQENNRLRTEISAYFQQQAAASSSSSSSTPSTTSATQVKQQTQGFSYKPAPPSPFYGEYNGSAASAWIYEIEQFFTVINIPDSQKVNVAANSFKKNAMTWFVHLRKVLQEASTEEQQILLDWSLFKKKFLDYFQPVEVTRLARAKLNNIKQTGSAASYCNLFTQYLNNMGGPAAMDIQQQLFLFRRGLLRTIRTYVDLKEPATLDEAMRIAQRYEAEEYVGRAEENVNGGRGRFIGGGGGNRNNRGGGGGGRPAAGGFGNYHYNLGNNGHGGNGGVGANNSGPVPMDLNNIRRVDNEDELDEDRRYGGSDSVDDVDDISSQHEHVNFVSQQKTTRVANLSKEELKRCMKAGICFKCKKQGHLARNCTSTQQTQQSKKY